MRKEAYLELLGRSALSVGLSFLVLVPLGLLFPTLFASATIAVWNAVLVICVAVSMSACFVYGKYRVRRLYERPRLANKICIHFEGKLKTPVPYELAESLRFNLAQQMKGLVLASDDPRMCDQVLMMDVQLSYKVE